MNFSGIELTNFQLWLLATAVVCIGWLIQHRLAVARERRASFSAAFKEEQTSLAALRVTEPGQVFDILSAGYAKHETAYKRLGLFDRLCLRRTWSKYRGPFPQPPELPTEDHRYRFAHFIGSNLDDEEVKRNYAIDLLTKLST